MIAEYLINLLKSKRDKKRHEIYQLRWEKAKLEKQLEQLKRQKAEESKKH